MVINKLLVTGVQGCDITVLLSVAPINGNLLHHGISMVICCIMGYQW